MAKHNVLLNEEELAIFRSLLHFKKYRKHQYILQQGDVARYDSFVLKGITRTYEVDDKGTEHILFFSSEDNWVGDLYSFLSGSPSRYNVDCIEDTEVLQVSRENLDMLYKKVPKMNQYFRILFQHAFISASERLGSSLSKSALQRYQEFRDKCPLTEQRIPNNLIASYLGITPQSLSRIRRQSSGKVNTR